MKKWNRRFVKGTNWALAGLLSLLGFSCSKENGGEMPLEYGSPYATFSVSGKVMDESGKVLSGICVIVPDVVHVTASKASFVPSQPSHRVPVRDTTYTSSKGTFEYTYNGFPTDTVLVNMQFEDVSRHPVYEKQERTAVFVSSEAKNGKGWDRGQIKKEVRVTLRKNNNDGK